MAKLQRLYCEAGRHEWERWASKGKPPLHCDECRRNKLLMAIWKAGRKKSEGAAAVVPAEQRQQAADALPDSRERLASAESAYAAALDAAVKTRDTSEIDRAFDRADRAMSTLIFANNETRNLERLAS